MKRLAAVTVLVALLVTAGVLWLDLDFLPRLVNPNYLGISMALFAGNYVFRAWRFNTLMGEGVRMTRLFVATGAHGALNYFIPARLGEISFPVFARKLELSTASVALSALVFSRMVDLLVVVLAGGLVVVTGIAPLPAGVVPVWLLLTGGGLSVAALAALRYGWILRLAARLPERFSGVKRALEEGLGQVETLSADRTVLIYVQTVAVWCLVWLNFYCLARAVGCPLEPAHAVLVSILLVPLSFLPAQGAANLGTYELAWVTVLGITGLGVDRALEFTIATHILFTGQFALLALAAGLGWLWLYRRTSHSRH